MHEYLHLDAEIARLEDRRNRTAEEDAQLDYLRERSAYLEASYRERA